MSLESLGIQVLLLGAGRPAYGKTPAALKPVSPSRRALDWQLDGLSDEAAISDIIFLGGYGVEEVIGLYPSLKFIVVPDWNNHSIVHTLLHAPPSSNFILAAYSDTIFRKRAVKLMLRSQSDITFGYDSEWKKRYDGREQEDISRAEKIVINESGVSFMAEFTGLLLLSQKARLKMMSMGEQNLGSTIPELISKLQIEGLSVEPVDLKGLWAEFNAPGDVARFVLGTKAETLSRLAPRVEKSKIGAQISFTVNNWLDHKAATLKKIVAQFKTSCMLIVRSSSASEDGWSTSQAGRFLSVGNVAASDHVAIALAIDQVVASYAAYASSQDQVLIQEHVSDIRLAGVAMTCGLDNGGPYITLNIDQSSLTTDGVTSGRVEDLRTVIISQDHLDRMEQIDPWLVPVVAAIKEIETILDYGKLDIEFAVDENGTIHILQVRPITVDHTQLEFDIKSFKEQLCTASQRFLVAQKPMPQIVGSRTIFGNMPDWNPAEILGARPRPLALSLYQRLITDDIWAAQRAAYGYRDVRSAPLLTSFMARPFVDVRASLNSFIPAVLDDDIATRLVDAGIELLLKYPHLHDKIEFEVAFTVWEPGFREKAKARYAGTQVYLSDIDALEAALKELTRAALERLEADIAPLKILNKRRQSLEFRGLSSLDTAFRLIEDCARFGTPAFAHAARAGFVAISLLKGLVCTGGLSEDRKQAFMQSLNTVARMLRADRASKLTIEQLILKYGHLRPGTYDITAKAYHENPDLYLSGPTIDDKITVFVPTSEELRALAMLLKELGSDISPEALFSYFRKACEMRESAKFEFTRNVSRALDLFANAGLELELDRDALSYISYNNLLCLRTGFSSPQALSAIVDAARSDHKISLLSELPSLLTDASDFQGFERQMNVPNFVTLKSAQGPIYMTLGTPPPAGSIILTPEADPGYDWLFDHKIAGFVTQYGGANSHMAIRAAELGVPAAIGVGENYFNKLSAMTTIELDCANQTIRELP